MVIQNSEVCDILKQHVKLPFMQNPVSYYYQKY